MKREVEKLEIANSKLFEKCINATKYDEQIRNQKTPNPRIEDFILKEGADSVCQDHVRKELPVSEHTLVLEFFPSHGRFTFQPRTGFRTNRPRSSSNLF